MILSELACIHLPGEMGAIGPLPLEVFLQHTMQRLHSVVNVSSFYFKLKFWPRFTNCTFLPKLEPTPSLQARLKVGGLTVRVCSR